MTGIKTNNALIKEALKSGTAYAQAETKAANEVAAPFMTFMGKCIMAHADAENTGLDDDKSFVSLLKSAGVAKQRASDMWRITKLGELDCHAALVKTLTEMKPSKSGLYFAACSIRATKKRGVGFFGGEDGLPAIAWKKDAKHAPSKDAIQNAINAGNKRSNAPKTAGGGKTRRERIASFVEWLDKNNNKVQSKTVNDKATKVQPLNNAALNHALTFLRAYLNPGKVEVLSARAMDAALKASVKGSRKAA